MFDTPQELAEHCIVDLKMLKLDHSKFDETIERYETLVECYKEGKIETI